MINPDSLIDPERLEEGAIEVGEEKLKFIKRKIEKWQKFDLTWCLWWGSECRRKFIFA